MQQTSMLYPLPGLTSKLVWPPRGMIFACYNNKNYKLFRFALLHPRFLYPRFFFLPFLYVTTELISPQGLEQEIV